MKIRTIPVVTQVMHTEQDEAPASKGGADVRESIASHLRVRRNANSSNLKSRLSKHDQQGVADTSNIFNHKPIPKVVDPLESDNFKNRQRKGPK